MRQTLLHSLLFPRWLAMGFEPMTMMAIASGIGALGNFFGGKSAASAAQKQADAQLKATQETNANNLRMFQESRGSTGSAVLPEYLKSYEAGLGADAAATAKALFGYGGGVNQRLADGAGILARYNPALEAGDNTVIDLATGRVGTQRQASLAPVLAARTGAAKLRSSAITDGLNETLANLRATRAGRGFRGGSTFDTNRALAATVGARAGAATEMGQARLDNALATQGLDESNLQLLLSSLDLPFQRGQQRLNFANLPATNAADFYRSALSPLDYFRIGPAQNLPYQQTPQIPTIPNTGQLAGAAVAGGAQSIGQYLAQQQLMQQLQSFYGQQPSYLGAGTWAGGGGDPGAATIMIPGFNS